MWRRISENATAVTNDALEATYIGFTLWTMAVRKAGSTRASEVRAALQGLSIAAPSGFRLKVTPDQHTTLPAFVGQIHPDGRIMPVWTSRATRDPAGLEERTSAAAA